MEKKYFKKIMICMVATCVLAGGLMPSVISDQNGTQDHGGEGHTETTEQSVTVTIIDCTSQDIKEYKKEIPVTKAEEILTALESPIPLALCQSEMHQKVSLLEANELISQKTGERLGEKISDSLDITQRRFNLPHNGIFFDVFNVFNGIFFAVRGVKNFTFFELNVTQFPLLGSNITAQFSAVTKLIGNGTVFTLGTLGFSYSLALHPKVLEGVLIGFFGILIEIQDLAETSYIGGIGMTVVTLWDEVDQEAPTPHYTC